MAFANAMMRSGKTGLGSLVFVGLFLVLRTLNLELRTLFFVPFGLGELSVKSHKTNRDLSTKF